MECGEYVLLDYLAVEPETRGQGIGSQVLPLLGEIIGDRTMLIEAENPACAPGAFPTGTPGRPASGFTRRAGCAFRGCWKTPSGSRYRILTGGRERTDEEVAGAMMDIYYAMVPEEIVRREVKTWIP